MLVCFVVTIMVGSAALPHPAKSSVSAPLAALCDHAFSHGAEADTEKMTSPVLAGLVFGGVVNNNGIDYTIGNSRGITRGVLKLRI